MERTNRFTRRRFVAVTGTLGTGVLAGCSGGSETTPTATELDADATVDVGPGGSLVYDPEELRVSTGDTVAWVARSRGHNVSFRTQDGDPITIPENAEPVASYENGNLAQTMDVGETFTHTFSVPGEYVYGCIPHLSANMVGRVLVE